MSMWMSTMNVVAGGWEEMMYGVDHSSFSLESLLKWVQDESIKSILTENFEMISQNTIYENYGFNALSYKNRQFDYSIFIPEVLSEKVASIKIEIEKSYYNNNTIFWLEKSQEDSLLVEVIIKSKDFVGETISDSINISRDMFVIPEWIDSEWFTIQLSIVLDDETIIPYSQSWYIYINGKTLQGKKWDLMNAYYIMNQNIWYPDVSSLMKAAFKNLEDWTASLESYLYMLERVSLRADVLIQRYTAQGDEIAKNVISQQSFEENIDPYGKSVTRVNLLNDALRQIKSEIETRKSTDIINELFSDF